MNIHSDVKGSDMDPLEINGESIYRDGDQCPNCEDGTLIQRYVRKFGGSSFIGCCNFPRCEFTADVDNSDEYGIT